MPHTLCSDCWREISFIRAPFCKTCGVPYPVDIFEKKQCPACERVKFRTNGIFAVTKYESVMREAIHRFKYNEDIKLAQFFSNLICNRYAQELCKMDVISCVPIHKIKLKQRRFNQASLIAKLVSKKLKIKFIPDLLEKTVNTKNQNDLTRKDRLKNLANAFAPNSKHPIKGLEIALIDDVITTGATVNECSRALKKAGARKVRAFSVARTY